MKTTLRQSSLISNLGSSDCQVYGKHSRQQKHPLLAKSPRNQPLDSRQQSLHINRDCDRFNISTLRESSCDNTDFNVRVQRQLTSLQAAALLRYILITGEQVGPRYTIQRLNARRNNTRRRTIRPSRGILERIQC